jgi:PIN domain nuclease of toxin-antitoxin system
MALLVDTGPFAFLLMSSRRMSDGLRRQLAREDRLYVSAVSFYEIGQKVRLGKWPDMEPFASALDETARSDGFDVVPLSGAIALSAAHLNWPHRDPFDRMIAATALREEVSLVSSDAAFDAVGIDRIWA